MAIAQGISLQPGSPGGNHDAAGGGESPEAELNGHALRQDTPSDEKDVQMEIDEDSKDAPSSALEEQKAQQTQQDLSRPVRSMDS